MSDHVSAIALRVVYALLIVTVLATVWDYGLTWDEHRAHYHGKILVSYYEGWFAGEPDRENLGFRKHYGGFFEIGAILLERGLGLDFASARHLLNATFGIVGVAGCAAIARALGGPQAALWAALLLVMSPRFYGHLFNNPKDIPFAAAYAWSLALSVRALRDMPALPLTRVAQLGTAIGVALAIRVGGLLLLAYLGLAMAGHVLGALRRDVGAALGRALPRLVASFAGVAAIAWVIMLAAWPWAQAAPLSGPLEALTQAGDFPFHLPVRFAGADFPASELPRSYAVHMLMITTPEIVLTLLAVGIFWGALRLRRDPRPEPRAVGGVLLVAFAGTFPVAWIAIRDATLYDGIRHLLFVLPPLTALAGLVLAGAVDRALRHSRMAGGLVLVSIASVLAFQLSFLVRLHPYQAVYYNALVGGLSSANGRYETEYWGSSYREAALRLVREVEAEEGGAAAAQGWTVMLCTRPRASPPILASHYLPDGWEMTKYREQADFYLAFARWGCPEHVPGRELFRVERQGVPLAVAKDLRPASSDAEPGAPLPPG